MESLLSVEQAAQRLNLGRSTLYRMVENRLIGHVRTGRNRRTIRLRPSDLEDYIAQNAVCAATIDGANGVTGEPTCHTRGKTRSFGGSPSQRQMAAVLGDLLKQGAKRKPAH